MQELRDKTPFHCIITGLTDCSKTQYLIEQFCGPFKGVFDYIVLICPTYAKNKTYRGFGQNDSQLLVVSPDASNCDEINDLLKHCATLFSGTNTFLVLDDCAVSKDLKKCSNKFINLAFSGRHEGLSVWVLTQQLTSIVKPFRENVACVVAFYNPSRIGTKTLFEDYGGDLDANTRKKFVDILKSERYLRICFCVRYPFHFYLEVPAASI